MARHHFKTEPSEPSLADSRLIRPGRLLAAPLTEGPAAVMVKRGGAR